MADNLVPALGQLTLGGPAAAAASSSSSSSPAPAAAAAANAVAAPANAAADDAPAGPPPPLPLAQVFDPVLTVKVLDGVDVCTLGCVCKDLSERVRRFWVDVEASRAQAAWLHVEDGDYEARVLRWGFSEWETGFRLEGSTAAGSEAQRFCYVLPDACSFCGGPNPTPDFPCLTDFPREMFTLCHACCPVLQAAKVPAHSHIARFLLAPAAKLAPLYLMMLLPASIAHDVRLLLHGHWRKLTGA